MRKLLSAFAFFCLMVGTVSAQNVIVSGALVGNGTYPDLGSAFTAINGGAQTGATIIVSIVGNTTELATATLNQGAWQYLYISPTGGAARTITGAFTGPLIHFNSADRVAIDGLNSGGNALTISNTFVGTASTIQFSNDARTNAVQKCTILGSNTATTSGTIAILPGVGGGGNDSIAISQCTIDAAGANLPVFGIYSQGNIATGQENSSITVSSCNIANFASSAANSIGITVQGGNADWTIQANRFYQTATRNYTAGFTHAAIVISGGGGHQVLSNIIGYSSSAGTGVYTMTSTVATRFIGINISGTGPNSVQGNTVTAISMTTSSGATTTNGILCGINVTGGSVDIGTITPNIIGGASGTGLITTTTSTSGGAVMGIHIGTTSAANVSNNVIGGISSLGTTAAIGSGITGIVVSAASSNLTISGNTIGNGDVDNMRGGTLGTTTGSCSVSGINLASIPVTATISQNIIRNLSSYGSGTAGFVRGIMTLASSASANTFTVSQNQVYDLKSNSTLATYANGLVAAGGIAIAAGTNVVVDRNTVYNISCLNTGTGGYVTMGLGQGNATGTIMSNNTIYNLFNSSTSSTVTAPGTIVGVLARSGQGNVVIRNNMISLGTGVPANVAIVGIMGSHGSTPDPTSVGVYHNTVNIAGTATSGAHPSFGIARTDWGGVARTVAYDIRNNIVTNSRTGGTGVHYAIGNNYGAAAASATGWGTNASNNNVLNANAANVGWWTTARPLCDWRSASACDGSSFSGITVSYVNPITNLHIAMGTIANAMESGGQLITSVLSDIDGDTRPGPFGSGNGGGTAPDLGADEFDGVPGDFSGPSITYTPLAFICTTGDRTLTATIADATGVPTSGTLQPRIYYRKNAGAWQSSQGVIQSGTAQNGTWDFSISAAAMGGVVLGDVISYYIIAQDMATPVNLNSNPVGCFTATDVNNVTTPPTTTSSYAIGGNISGTYTVGTTGTYTTLGAAVSAYNNGCLTGPITYELIDAAYPSETYPITITQNPYSSATNTMRIRPTLPNTSIIGTSATMLIGLIGADYVTIDGSTSNTTNSCCPYQAASRDLTIQNTNTNANSAVIWMGTSTSNDAATHLTVKNCKILGNSTAATLVGIGSGAATVGLPGTNNHYTTIENNDIRGTQLAVYSAGQSSAVKNRNLRISQNTIARANPTVTAIGGIYATFTDSIWVTCNTVDSIVNTASQDIYGINVGFGVTGGITSTTPGIADGVTNVWIEKNKLSAIIQSGTFSSAGILLGNTVSGTTSITNNMISGVMANGTGGDFSGGIVLGGGNAIVNVDHNSVSLTGTMQGATAGTQTAACLAVTAATAPSALFIRNNVFSNTQVGNTGATTRFAAIALRNASPYSGITSDYNDLYAAGAGPGTYQVGLTGGVTGGTARATLLDWQTETGQDGNSANVLPSFTASNDLHLTAVGNQPLSNNGMALTAVTNDIDCDSRSATTPDRGADEFIAACVTASVGGIIPGDSSSCVADSIVLAALTYSDGGGSGYSWESSPFGLNTWTPVVGANNPDYFNTGIVTGPTDYRLVVTCATNSSTAISDTITFFVGDSIAPAALCQPQTVGLDTTGNVVVNPADFDDGSSDNCTAPGALSYSLSQTSFDCGTVGLNNVVLTVTDAAGNTSTCATTLQVNPTVFTATVNAAVLANGQNVSCNGGNDGAATVSGNGGCPTYTYLWSDGQTTATATGLVAATYTVTITDGSGQADTLTVTITEPSVIGTSTTSTLETCVPGTDGTATVSVTGGSPGYTYLWNTGGTTATITGLVAGNYSVQVTDTMGCVENDVVTVSAATAPAAPVITQNGNNLETAATGGSLQWFLNGNPIGTGSSVAIQGAGNYTVTITDTNGCSATSQPFVVISVADGLDTQVELWPNPTRGSATVRLAGSDLIHCDLQLTDLRGRLLQSWTDQDLSNGKALDLREFAAGTYLVTVTQGAARSTLRLVVQ